MDCRSLENLYELFLLGALSEEDEARVREHLIACCPRCIEGLREAALALYAVLQSPRQTKQRESKAKPRLHQRLRGKRG